MKTTDQLRDEFKNRGLTYTDITWEDILKLECLLIDELRRNNNGGGLKMTLNSLRKRDYKLKEDGTLKNCFFMVNSNYFNRREAISFCTEGTNGNIFIGFAGWSDSDNLTPFLEAFKRFIIHLEIKRSPTQTLRGFDVINFEDSYGVKCSLQKSSTAMEDMIWLGIDKVEPTIMISDAEKLGIDTWNASVDEGWVSYDIPEEVLLSTRMHLTQEQVKKILPFLINFVETGDL